MSGQPFIPNDIDVQIGETISILRTRQGMTQKDLAKRLGITFQQIQKYETASNRIAASRLFKIARELDVPIAILFGESGHGLPYDRQINKIIKLMLKLNHNDCELLIRVAQRLSK